MASKDPNTNKTKSKENGDDNENEAKTFSAKDAVDKIVGKMRGEYDDFVTACEMSAQYSSNQDYKSYLKGYGYNDEQMMKIKYQVLTRSKKITTTTSGMSKFIYI